MFNFSFLNNRNLSISFNESNDTTEVVVQGLPVGASHTIFHVVRRFAQSFLPSYRVYAVRINGVTNEFSTIPSLAQNTVDVLKNFSLLSFHAKNAACNNFATKMKNAL